MGVTTITQDVNDFLRSPYGQAIVTNSSMQVLLKQSPAAIDLIQKTFTLTDGEKYLLLESGVGEGIFFAGNKHAAIKIVASYTEDQIVTTNPQQLLEIEAAKKEFEKQTQAPSEERPQGPAEGGGAGSEGAPVGAEAENMEDLSDEEIATLKKAEEDAAAALLAAEAGGVDDKTKNEGEALRNSLTI